MSAQTDGSLIDDEVIEILKRVGHQIPTPLTHNIDDLVTKGRHVRRRRRAFIVPASSVAVTGVAVLVYSLAYAGTNQRQQLFLSPASSGSQDSPRATPEGDIDLQVLQDAFGGDFTVSPASETGPTPGNLTVKPGSQSAVGLPAGVTLWTQLIYGGPGGIPAGQLGEFCAPMVEKGLHRSACTRQVLPNGQVVYVQPSYSNPSEYKSASRGVLLPSDGIRVIYAQTNGQLVIVDLVASEDVSASTHDKRAAVQAWLDGMTSHLITAATDSRIDAMSGVDSESKGAPASSKPTRLMENRRVAGALLRSLSTTRRSSPS